MFRMNGTPRAQGCAGAVPFSFARCLAQGCAGAASPKLARHIVMNGYVQDERYIAIEHMDVRRDCVNSAHGVIRTNGYVQDERYTAGAGTR